MRSGVWPAISLQMQWFARRNVSGRNRVGANSCTATVALHWAGGQDQGICHDGGKLLSSTAATQKKPLFRSPKPLRILAGALVLAIAWICFQLGTHRHTGILRTLAGAQHFLSRELTRQAVPQKQETAPPRPRHSVTLSWGASTSAGVAYNVYRRGRLGIVRINSVPITGTSYVDTTVQPGETYYYTTKAVNAKGAESHPSNELRVTVPSP